MKKKEFNIKTIFTWLRSEKGKKYSFFVFYFFFFIFLFIYLKVTSNYEVDNSENNYRFPYQISILENNNYSFQYLLTSNLKEEEYLVEKSNSKLYVKDDQGIVEYSYKNGVLITDNDRIPYSKLLNIFELKRLIKNSVLETETKMNTTGETIYNYSISNQELANIFNVSIDSALELNNNITIKSSSDKKIKEIRFNLLNYENMISDSKYSNFEIVFIFGDANE